MDKVKNFSIFPNISTILKCLLKFKKGCENLNDMKLSIIMYYEKSASEKYLPVLEGACIQKVEKTCRSRTYQLETKMYIW